MPTTWIDTVLRQTRRFGAGPYPHEAAALLDNPLRALFTTHARLVVDALELADRERVLEIGPGSGFFSRRVAGALPTGRLDLFDVQPEMLAKARRKLDAAGLRNVGYHSGDAGDGLPFDDDAFDAAFLAGVIGEVPDKTSCIESLARVIKPGGRLVFLEVFPDPDRLTVAQLRELVEPQCFTLSYSEGNRWHDVVRFVNGGAPGTD